jgi:hypothetical protein
MGAHSNALRRRAKSKLGVVVMRHITRRGRKPAAA